jgi:redox-sensitive bicupin YhaK (pirin superfamily)
MASASLDPVAKGREVAHIIDAFLTPEGDGMIVRRALPAPGIEAVGPFIFLDQFGPLEFGPGEARGAPSHPHRGIETLSYILEGRVEHLDSLGNVGTIGPLGAQWMRAGRGILHDEGADAVLRRDGGRVHGFQFWINLPQRLKMSAPAYRAFQADDIPQMAFGGGRIRQLAGSSGGMIGPVPSLAQCWLAHVSLDAGADLELSAPADIELAAYVALGEARLGEAASAIPPGQLAVFSHGSHLRIRAETASELFVFGGEPLDAPIRRYGPFVMNTNAEIQQAVIDFQRGLFGSIPPR